MLYTPTSDVILNIIIINEKLLLATSHFSPANSHFFFSLSFENIIRNSSSSYMKI